jgi:MarR family transcriptional regulator, organic hydroperoxide resistance regulator
VDLSFFPVFGALRRATIEFVDRRLQAHGVRVGQQFVLQLLWESQTDVTIGEIAAQLGFEAPTITRTIQRMIRQGLVEKYPHATDGRLVLVRLTPRGRNLSAIIPGVLAQAQEDLFVGISEVEQALLLRLFRHMLHNISEDPSN